MNRQDHETYQFGRFSLNPSRHTLYLGKTEVVLAPKTFEVLLYLARNPGRLVSKEELLSGVWANSFIEESNLAQQIFRLRKAFAAEPGGANLIVTMPGRGYQFTAEVRQRFITDDSRGVSAEPVETVSDPEQGVARWSEDPQEPADEPTAKAKPVLRTDRTETKKFIVVTGFLVLATVGWWAGWRWKNRMRAGDHYQVLVADFANRTGDRAFDNILTSALEIDLSQSPYMSVMGASEALPILQLIGVANNSVLTPDLARQVCERANRQVVFTGSIASVGSEYLLLLRADDCYSGKTLASAKATVKTKEDVLRGLDEVAARVRESLGESAGSFEQFQVPIAQATTSSLEALKDYSTGEFLLGRMGKDQDETLPLFLRATEIDPHFAMAFAAVATAYHDLGESDLAKPYYQKAFELSGGVSQKEKLYIRAHYYADALQDKEKGIQDYELWAETYPHDWGPWLDIAKEQDDLGQYSDAAASAEQALKLDPSRGIIYSVLARSYMHSNRLQEAKDSALHAVRMGKQSIGLHLVLLEVACREQDQEAIARELVWSQDKPGEWKFLEIKALELADSGRYKEAKEIFQSAYNSAIQQNLQQKADDILITQAGVEFDFGLPRAALVTLHRLHQPVVESPELVILRAKLGETTVLKHFLATHIGSPNTLMTRVYLPIVSGLMARERGKPLDEIEAMASATPYETRDYEVSTLRGEAYQGAGKGNAAIAEYKKILANAGAAPVSVLYPLAHLGLARAYALAGEPVASASEYRSFLALWKDADPDLRMLQTAKTEYAVLTKK